MEASVYFDFKNELINAGYADEIDWQTNVQPCDSSFTFRDEAIWVILNSGMKNQVARIISNRIKEARNAGKDISEAFNHKGKVEAIKYIWSNCGRLFIQYCRADDKVGYLETLPRIS